MRFEQIPNPEHTENSPDRFGGRERIIAELESSPVEVIGPIHTVFPNDIEKSTNEVALAVVAPEEKGRSLVNLAMVHPSDGRQDFYAVFKPFSGENRELKQEQQISALYTRELIAAEVAEYLLELDITPPITIRAIEGQIGTLQQFISHVEYPTLEHFTKADYRDYPEVGELKDECSIAVFDFITLQTDRHDGNMLVHTKFDPKLGTRRLDRSPEAPSMIAIDNAMCLSAKVYQYNPWQVGPDFGLTGIRTKEDRIVPRHVAIPEELLEKVAQGLDRWDAFYASIQPLLSEQHQRHAETNYPDEVPLEVELEWMRQRMEALIFSGEYLSRANCYELPVAITSSSSHPHPPLRARR